eukprot:m.241394 g.241394  ORF g.241394 m.241394 type:complete len:483 (+) comp33773_c3_seq1:882-2330(+)
MFSTATTVLAAVTLASVCTADLTDPSWDFVPANIVDECVDATSRSTTENARWVTYALPTGTPPTGGWPVFLILVTDNYPVRGKTCGTGSQRVRKNFTAFATPKDAVGSCYGDQSGMALTGVDTACDDAMAASCSTAAKGGIESCITCAKAGPIKAGTCSLITAYEWCSKHSGGGPGQSGCMYDKEAGAMWDHRLKQYLLSNGVAVFNVNPIQEDSWDAFDLAWEGKTTGYGGVDKPFLQLLFQEMTVGKFGAVDMSQIVIRGWSSGAQMVSWLFEVTAQNSTLFQSVPKFAGGVFLSGGSYACYNDAQGSPAVPPVGSCATCTEGGPDHCADDPKCSSCAEGSQPYCQQCCPKNYTEQWYEDHADQYHTHPPVFLAQTSTSDTHADLCACKNYYNSMQARAPSVMSQLVLVAKEDESCFCVGNPNNTAAAGSPFASSCSKPTWGTQCGEMGGPDCCITHTYGFADMILPATKFVIAATTPTN